ncbi:MAG TPA: hypothetical protein VMJ31_11830 [Methylocystis sp.]|nr:hypothetical protein [Methylocystis sp.]
MRDASTLIAPVLLPILWLGIYLLNRALAIHRCDGKPERISRAFWSWSRRGMLFASFESSKKLASRYGVSESDLKTVMWFQLFAVIEVVVVTTTWLYLVPHS